jgi:hypothetical protein
MGGDLRIELIINEIKNDSTQRISTYLRCVSDIISIFESMGNYRAQSSALITKSVTDNHLSFDGPGFE